MMEYKLKWNWLLVPIVWIFWVQSKERKTWHLVLKGLEPHKHHFVIPTDMRDIYQCDHEGCNLCDNLSA